MAKDQNPSPFPTLPADLPRSSPLATRAGTALALERATLLAGQFRRSDADDPETFAGAWAVVMADFPPVVLDEVIHPAKGLAIRSNFLPSVMEVREACIAAFNAMLVRWENERLPPERKAYLDSLATPKRQVAYERRVPPSPAYLTKMEVWRRNNWGIQTIDDERPRTGYTPPSAADIVQHYSQHGLGIPLSRNPKGPNDHGQDHHQDQSRDGVMADAGAARGESDQPQAGGAAAQGGGHAAAG